MVVIKVSNEINLSPVTLEEEISQNISHLLNTIEGTVPLNRKFGLSFKAVDKPSIEAKSLYIQEVYEKVSEFEPRLKIESIEIDESEVSKGILKPIIKGKIIGG